MTTRRDRWAQYYAAATMASALRLLPRELAAMAQAMLNMEEEGFGPLPEVEPPPLGPSALPWLERIDKLTLERDDARSQAELLEDDVRTLEERCAQLKLERDTLQAWADGLGEQGAAVPEWTRAEPLMDGYFWLRHPTGNPTPGIVEVMTDCDGRRCVWSFGATDGRPLSKLDDGFEWAGPLSPPVAAEQRAAAKPAEGGETGEG